MAPNNPLPIWGNEKTMNLNPLILTNIQSSPYFKVNLYELKTYHEVIDEIYYKVDHLEPWEKGSRKTAGQTGMCGGVRGVGAGGIVSSAYCLLYKLYTLKLTRKQLIGLITHQDSPYIRGLGFMYIRYTQDPKDMWDWYKDYMDDEEEIDVKAGTGHKMTIGEMIRQWMVKLEWYSTLFPRIPVPVQKDLVQKLKENPPIIQRPEPVEEVVQPRHIPDGEVSFGEAERHSHRRPRSPSDRSPVRRSSPHRSPRRSPPRRKSRSRSPRRRSPQYSTTRRRSPHNRRSPRKSPPRRRNADDDFARELEKERERQRRDRDRDREKDKKRRRSSSRERSHKKHSKSSRGDKYQSGSQERTHKHSHKDKSSRSPTRHREKHSLSPSRDRDRYSR